MTWVIFFLYVVVVTKKTPDIVVSGVRNVR